ncbi:transmembrane protein 199, partial [Asbolus verrucosus]
TLEQFGADSLTIGVFCVEKLISHCKNSRGDREVDYLFKVIENITDIKDTEINRFKEVVNLILPKTHKKLQQALTVCNRFAEVEQKYKECCRLETARQQRKIDWENFMDYITTSYSEINSVSEIMNTGQISNPSVHIKPAKLLRDYISTVKISPEIPVGIANIIYKNKLKKYESSKPAEPKYLTTDEDRQFLKTIKLNSKIDITKLPLSTEAIILENDKLLNLQDLHWLYNYIQKDNENKTDKIYLHSLLEGSQIVLPKNNEIPRNTELEKRCERLRASQQNEEYNNMTKNVDSVRRRHPEDTISFQMQQMNRHLIAISQFIMSVLAGFAFGFIGVELIIGNLDFGFRLLLGIICALIIALAELYFLAKKLNEDLKFETEVEKKNKSTKLD